MYFAELHQLLVEHIRQRLYNGEFTERGLAKRIGVSQPHIHNAVNGRKGLSPELCDRVLDCLGLSILDLIGSVRIRTYLTEARLPGSPGAWVRTLETRLGPGEPWPQKTSGLVKFAISSADLLAMTSPVAAQCVADSAMTGQFSPGAWAILDQEVAARQAPRPGRLYLINNNGVPLIRFARVERGVLQLFGTDPAASDSDLRFRLNEAGPAAVLRARVTFVAEAQTWIREAEKDRARSQLERPTTSR